MLAAGLAAGLALMLAAGLPHIEPDFVTI